MLVYLILQSTFYSNTSLVLRIKIVVFLLVKIKKDVFYYYTKVLKNYINF